jgi:hypothetical protein
VVSTGLTQWETDWAQERLAQPHVDVTYEEVLEALAEPGQRDNPELQQLAILVQLQSLHSL